MPSLSELLCCFQSKKKIESDFDPRFGSPSITSPMGGFIDPRTKHTRTISAPIPAPPSKLPPYELRPQKGVEGLENAAGTKLVPVVAQSQPNSPKSFSSVSEASTMPVHEAFIPNNRHTMRTASVSVSASSPQSSPPSSPPLPTPDSTGSRPSRSPPAAFTRDNDGKAGLDYTMSMHHRMNAVKIITAQDIKRDSDSPASAQSVEQWPGKY